MFYTIIGVIIRIFSNSFLNVFQKILTRAGQKSSAINFYTYLGLLILILPVLPLCRMIFTTELVLNVIFMGLLGALGNYFIIKALSIGELSTLAPINSYKPVVALIAGIIYLHEIPSLHALFAIALIIAGTYFIMEPSEGLFNRKAVLYRVMALIFSATEAVFIKKIIILTDVLTAFVLWIVSGFVFALVFVLFSRQKLKISSYKYQFFLVLSVALMQYFTNYVFARMNVSYALALFQLSTLLSVIFGVSIFKEGYLKRKLGASCLMIAGAVIIILS